MLAAVAAGQRRAESIMLDTCTIKRPIPGEFEEGPDGYSVPAYEPDAIYAGPCKRKVTQVSPSEEMGGGETVTTTRPEVHVPAANAGRFLPGDHVFMGADTTPTFRVLEDHVETFQTACRLPVERVR